MGVIVCKSKSAGKGNKVLKAWNPEKFTVNIKQLYFAHQGEHQSGCKFKQDMLDGNINTVHLHRSCFLHGMNKCICKMEKKNLKVAGESSVARV